MCIVAQQDQFVAFYPDVKPAVNTLEGLHSLSNHIIGRAAQLCHSHRRNTILYVHLYGNTETDAFYISENRNKVKCYLASAHTNVVCVEIACCQTVGQLLHASLKIRAERQSGVNDQCSARLYQMRIFAEALQISVISAIYVQMIRVGSRHDADVGTQPVERAVKLISLNNHIIAFIAEQIVCAIVLGDASHKCVALLWRLHQQMGNHCCCRRLAVCACHTKSFHALRQYTQNLSPFFDFKITLTEIIQLLMVFGNGGSINHQRCLLIAECFRNQVGVILKVQVCTFFEHSVCQRRSFTVIACNSYLLQQEVAHQCAHTYSAGSDKVY